jgi:hypothetical protein
MHSVISGTQTAAERLTVKSALNPLLWLSVIVTPLLLTAAYYFSQSDILRVFCAPLVYVALGLVVLTTLAGCYLVLFRPEKLQSEEYQLRQQALLLIQQSSVTRQTIDAASLVALVKSAAPRR